MILEVFSNPNNSTSPRGTDVLVLPRFSLDATFPWGCLTWEWEVFPGEETAGCWHTALVSHSPSQRPGMDSSASPDLGQAGSLDGNELWKSDQSQMCRFLLSKAGAVDAIFTPSLTSTAGMCQIWGLEVLGLVVLTDPGGQGRAGCAFSPHTKKSDLPQLIDRISFSWCTAVQTIIYYVSALSLC